MPASRERSIQPERLDHASPQETSESLLDLERINRYFGGYAVLRTVAAELVRPQDSFSLLDVGSASGDMGAELRRRYPRAEVTSLDKRDLHLANAAPPKLVGDAFQLPFGPRSFDFVFSSLFLHHFSNDQVVDLFESFKNVARRAVLAIDLERGPLAYHFLSTSRWLFGWRPITVSDGQISVNAGFKQQELLALAMRAGLTQARVTVHRPWARLGLVAPV